MSLGEFMREMERIGVRLRVEGDELAVSAPKGAMTGELREKIMARRSALLELLDGAAPVEDAGKDIIARRAVPGSMKLSFAQERLWFIAQLNADRAADGNEASTLFNIHIPLQMRGALNTVVLADALREIYRRQNSLRGVFYVCDGVPMQRVSSEMGLDLEEIDLSAHPADRREALLKDCLDELSNAPISLTDGSVFRCRLIRLASDEHLLLISVHHIVADGWSVGVLFRELTAIYRAYSAGQPSPLPDPPIQYGDYAIWQREQIGSKTFQDSLDYWKKRLLHLDTLQLAHDYVRPAVQRFNGSMCERTLSPALMDKVMALGQRQATTPFILLLAAFMVMLHRQTGQENIVIGSPVANRRRPELEDLIGFFSNILVLDASISGDESFIEVLSHVREVCLAGYEHQEVPFEMLVEELSLERDLSRNPLFQVSFMLEYQPIGSLQLDGLEVGILSVESQTTRVDLECHVAFSLEGLVVRFVYNTDLFDERTIESALEQYRQVLEKVVSEPEVGIRDIELISECERRQTLVEWNAPKVVTSGDQTVLDRFSDWVTRLPEQPAAEFEEESVSYGRLDAETNRLARFLRYQGVQPGDVVALSVQRNPDLVRGVLSIWKAGAAYLPLDPEYPDSRLRFMLEDAEIRCVLTDSLTEARLKAVCSSQCLVDIASPGALDFSDECAPTTPIPGDLAYMIYTSGSTGQPKGVLLEHRGLANVSREQVRVFGVAPGHRVLQFSSPSFDAATFDMVMALGSGATLVLADPESILPGPPLAETLRSKAISLITIPPSALGALPQINLPSLQVINVAGEACPAQLVARWSVGKRRFFNLYGPTEATIWSTYTQCEDDGQAPAIGRPISNVPCYVLDAYGHLAPVGVFGELYIGGAGVSRGYWRRPELNRERFLPDLFSLEESAIMYRTGDRVRWRDDGELQFDGRIDSQVKLRGYRVEPGEIEAVICTHPGVDQALVECLADENGDQRLAAYLVLEDQAPPSVAEMRKYVRTRMPGYMVPASWVLLEALPINHNGKVDRSALPKPGRIRQVQESYVAPRTDLERMIAKVWGDVLKLDVVGIDDNFFELGGNSLLAMRARSLLGDSLNHRLPIVDLFEFPSIRALASRCELLTVDRVGNEPVPGSLDRIQARARRSRTAIRSRGHRTIEEG